MIGIIKDYMYNKIDQCSKNSDEGISGTLFVNRPSIELLSQKETAIEIDMVVFKSISHLARDLKDSLEIREVSCPNHFC